MVNLFKIKLFRWRLTLIVGGIVVGKLAPRLMCFV